MKTVPCRRCRGTGKEPDQSTIGAQMRALRENAGLSLRSVACVMKVSAAYVSDLELGRRPWSEDRMAKFKDALNGFQTAERKLKS